MFTPISGANPWSRWQQRLQEDVASGSEGMRPGSAD